MAGIIITHRIHAVHEGSTKNRHLMQISSLSPDLLRQFTAAANTDDIFKILLTIAVEVRDPVPAELGRRLTFGHRPKTVQALPR